ncbi:MULTISPECIES: hypothetical protein [Parachlamydia]|uniref:hypothetical protein n=1 Tax=Parachlamydia TaxID=83551 RepID=UPI0007511083|nr:hypothetical protein [Parachlamydia acanthamoebae]
MRTNDPVFEEVKNYFSFALRGAFAGLDGMTLSKIYFMFLSGIELISQSGRCCKILPIGLEYCYAMHTFFGRPAPPWEDPYVKIRFTGEHVKELLVAAKTKISAWMAAKELAARLQQQKDPIPIELQSFLIEMDEKTMPKRQRGRHSHEKLFRDFHIVILLNSVYDTHLPITRNPDLMYGKENSRCDAMKLALESVGISLSYEAIRSIWYKREKHRSIFQEFPSPLKLLLDKDLSVLNK